MGDKEKAAESAGGVPGSSLKLSWGCCLKKAQRNTKGFAVLSHRYIDTYPDAQCITYLPTFTPKTTQM